MKKKFGLVIIFIMSVLLLSSCQKAESNDETQTDTKSENTTTLSGTVTLGGSSSMEKVIEALNQSFSERNPGVALTYTPSGSSAGILGTQNGTLDIGLSSRLLKEEESGLDEVVIALDGIAIIVNKENPVTNLTKEQLQNMATGEITNWQEVGGDDAPVVFCGREAGSGTREGFESIVGVENECKYDVEYNATGGIIGSVFLNKNAIGYVSLATLGDKVKTVSIDGIAATEENIQDGSYKIQRPFIALTKQGTQQNSAVESYLAFINSEAASSIITNAGAIPVVKQS